MNKRIGSVQFESEVLRKPALHIAKPLCLIVKRQPTVQMAHLVFADTHPNAEKPKEPFFANAPTKKN